MLRYARCSCWTKWTKRLVCVAVPLLAFCATAVAVVAGSWNERCAEPLHEYLIVTGTSCHVISTSLLMPRHYHVTAEPLHEYLIHRHWHAALSFLPRRWRTH